VRKTIVLILIGFNLLAALALVISCLSVHIPPDKWWLPSFFGLGYPVILGINVFFIVLWLLVNPRYMWLSAVVIVLGLGTLSRFVQFKGKTIETGDIKVISYNVMHFGGNKKLPPKETADEIKNFLLEQRPDIICMQEVRLWKNSIFNLAETVEEFDFINHYQFARSSTTFGSVTLTRYPIVNMDEIRFENSKNITIYTDLLIGSDTVRVFNVHLQSYQIDTRKYSFIESGVDDEKDLDDMREVGARFKKGFQLRAQQARKIREYINNSPYHVLVCGDFNDPPASYAYRQLRKGLNDAFVESGSGIGRTYVGKLPSFRIDYILHSQGFESYNFKTYDFVNSDHLPVSAELVMMPR
jgi:endonuclease/exonuclease/phosphatase family metal-dependent hydrolase